MIVMATTAAATPQAPCVTVTVCTVDKAHASVWGLLTDFMSSPVGGTHTDGGPRESRGGNSWLTAEGTLHLERPPGQRGQTGQGHCFSGFCEREARREVRRAQ